MKEDSGATQLSTTELEQLVGREEELRHRVAVEQDVDVEFGNKQSESPEEQKDLYPSWVCSEGEIWSSFSV